MNTKVIKTFSSSESDTFDVINEQGVVLAYYYVNYRDPISNKVLKDVHDYIKEGHIVSDTQPSNTSQ